jgi:hypothetical protein
MTRVLSTFALTLWALLWQAPPTASVRTWLGHEPQIEAHLARADVTSLEDIGTGVTHPRRAHLAPAAPVESFVWKVLPPSRRTGTGKATSPRSPPTSWTSCCTSTWCRRRSSGMSAMTSAPR